MKAHPAAKRRGWGERTEIGGKDGGAVVIQMNWGDNVDGDGGD
jgi:hypothetical protein